MEKLLKRFFNLNAVFGTAFVFGFIWLFATAGVQFEFLDVVGEALEDFSLTDVYYRMREDKEVDYDDRIVLVNIGDLPRSQIARQILILNQYEPAVIGIDALFYGEKDGDSLGRYSGDDLLELAIKKTNHFVIAGEAINRDNDNMILWETMKKPEPRHWDNAHKSFVNTFTEEGGDLLYNTWKKICPKYNFKDSTTLYCFAGEIVRHYDSTAFSSWIGRNNDYEDIYFKGNIPSNDTTMSSKYTVLDVYDVLDENFVPEAIKGKIVIMGYMGEYIGDTRWHNYDKFYTPLNPRQIGRTYPDMYGVVVHANIVSMILDRKYINEMSPWLANIIGVVFTFLLVRVFIMVLERPRLAPWYGAISKVTQLIIIIAITFITIEFFDTWLYKTDFSLAIVGVALSGDLVEIMMDFIVNVIRANNPRKAAQNAPPTG